MRYLLFIFIFLFNLYGAQIDKKLLEDNATVYNELLSFLNKSQSAEAKLQKTIILKIKNLSKEFQVKEIDIDKIKTDKQYVEALFSLIDQKVENEALKKDSEKIKENLEDLKSSIEDLDQNATNLLTLQLQYAYFYKRLKIIKDFTQKVDEKYQILSKKLLEKIKGISFKYDKYKKTLPLFQKKIDRLNKIVNKLLLEKERYKLLSNERALISVEDSIDKYYSQIDDLQKNIVKIELIKFFENLKAKKEEVLSDMENISNDISKLHKNPDLYREYLGDFLNEALKLYFGDMKAYIFRLKESIFSFMKEKTLFDVPLYKFAGGFGIFLLFLIFRKLFSLIVIKTLQRLVRKTQTSIDDKILRVVSGPLKFAFVIIGLYLGFDYMGISSDFVQKLIRSLIIFTIFWFFYDLVTALESSIYKFAKKFGKEMYREIGAFFVKTLKIFVFSVGLVAILQEWSINVSAFLASLGLGGLAFALAAKDTAANLFGGLTILADSALKIDDWIKVGSVEGTVEEIGLRTTKIRTFEKSLVTVPNQMIANNPIENFSRRGIRRIKMRVGLTYSTSRETMQKILEDIKSMLKSHPGIAQNATMLVNFDEMQDSSLSIFVYTFTNTAVWSEYMDIREDVNLKIMEIVEKYEDADFAFPSQSIYVEKLPKGEA